MNILLPVYLNHLSPWWQGLNRAPTTVYLCLHIINKFSHFQSDNQLTYTKDECINFESVLETPVKEQLYA